MTSTSITKTYEDGVREERDRIAAWLDEQRKDVPAHGWEFAAALRAEDPATTQPAGIEQALTLMWAFATALIERHGMNGDDTLTDADHRAWQEASGAASAALQKPVPDWTVIRNGDAVELRPISSAARQWAIDTMPDGLVPDGGAYRVNGARSEAVLQSMRDEEFVIAETKGACS